MDEYISKLWKSLIENGRKKEKGTINHICENYDDLNTFYATLDYFGKMNGLTKMDVEVAKYKIYDLLGMCLTGRYDEPEKIIEHSKNIFVALAVIYINTNTIQEFIDFLRYIDLEPWIGEFDTQKFSKFVKNWTKEDELIKSGR